MTDNEIIKAMQCVIGNEALCSECTYQKVLPFPSRRRKCAKNALDLINRLQDEKQALINGQETLQNTIVEQKAEIERLKHRKTELQIRNQELQHEKSEAIKEFAEKLKNCFAISGDYLEIINIIDNLVKEMTEV